MQIMYVRYHWGRLKQNFPTLQQLKRGYWVLWDNEKEIILIRPVIAAGRKNRYALCPLHRHYTIESVMTHGQLKKTCVETTDSVLYFENGNDFLMFLIEHLYLQTEPGESICFVKTLAGGKTSDA